MEKEEKKYTQNKKMKKIKIKEIRTKIKIISQNRNQ